MERAVPHLITRRVKVGAYLAAWLLALFVTNPSAGLLPLVYMFPMGLAAVFYPPALRDDGWTVFIGCYAVYLVHAVFYFRTGTAPSTYLWFAILIVLLVCNVAGCREMINQH